jgi:uncharacterized membrane protein
MGTAFHLLATHLRGDVNAIAAMTTNTVLADWLFTSLAAIVQAVTGFPMIYMAGYDPLESWLVATYVLYALAGACWLKVLQLQLRMRTLAVAASERGDSLPLEYYRAFKLWCILGWPAFSSLMFVFALMVVKPDVW